MQQQDNHEYPFLYQRQTCHQVQPNQATYQKRQKCQPATYLQEVLYQLRSEERFSRNAETDLVCRLLLEKKKKQNHRAENGTYESQNEKEDALLSLYIKSTVAMSLVPI